ncbi:tetraacyldisaccharide 4'-kinase [Wenyingzhuangia sp. IMCC45533]
MIKFLRLVLFPLSVVYAVVTSIRNLMFDMGLLKATSFELPVICVGNLSAGGTGKTPQIEYLIRLLSDSHRIATLSRGYKRKTKGFILADESTTSEMIGDEPYQYYNKFEKIEVAVDANRVNGVKQILKLRPKTEVVLLDDAYQHRKIKAGFNILLSSYDCIFYNDFMLPTGNLREMWWGKKRADIIIVTKCPGDLSEKERLRIERKIGLKPHQQLFFSTIRYAESLNGTKQVLLKEFVHQKITVVTGIAKPVPFLDYLTSLGIEFEHLEYPDHHHFTKQELSLIKDKATISKILTTEKDYVRLEKELDELYYLPIKTEIMQNETDFDEAVLNFVSKF